jgi:uncharacterized cysteine cluster protein YcgN (CxxCxxCC family)
VQNSVQKPFWLTKKMTEMSKAEWESLCDGCGRCCLNKLEDWDNGDIYWTNIACSELDCDSCRCNSYENRFDVVPDCIDLTPEKVEEITWLPPTCAYQLVKEGKDLHDWHPLKSGDPNTVHTAGISVRGKVVSEVGFTPEDYEDHLVTWPGEENKKKILK